MSLLVTLNSLGQITNDSLQDLQACLERNRGECELSIGDITGQTLRIAKKHLKDSNVFEASFQNGEKVFFVGRLPQFVTPEAAMQAAQKA